MRTLECGQCGQIITAEDDEELVKAAAEHFADKHKFLPVSEDKIRATVTEKARDA